MRKYIFRIACLILSVLPVLYAVEIYRQQDIPAVAPWKWGLLLVTLLTLYFSRNTDEVLRHRVV